MEKYLINYPTTVSLAQTRTIVKQMENCICKIYNNEGSIGTGFFTYIKDIEKDKTIPVMITNNHVLNENDLKINQKIKISFNDEEKFQDIIIDNKRKTYTNELYDITIIEIKKDKDNIINESFLEIDERIYLDDSEVIFKQKSIYIIQYPEKQGASVSYGILKKIEDFTNNIEHYCSTNKGSSGAPILFSENNKVIGVHKGHSEKYEYNKGTFLINAINEFFENKLKKTCIKFEKNKEPEINKNPILFSSVLPLDKNTDIGENKIEITLKIEKNDVNKEIYFLDNTNKSKEDNFNKNPHCYLQELNNENTELLINEVKYKYQKYFTPSEEGNYIIKLKFKNNLTDCSHMFYFCKNIIKIDLSHFNTDDVTNMSNMFCYCTNLINIKLSSLNTKNVKNMSYMFSYCANLKEIKLKSFNIQNVDDMHKMFAFCNKLEKVDISSFIPSNNLNIDSIFERCWNIKNLKLNKLGDKIFRKETKGIDGIKIEVNE